MKSILKTTIFILISSALVSGDKEIIKKTPQINPEEKLPTDLQLIPSTTVNPQKVQTLRQQMNAALSRLKRFSTGEKSVSLLNVTQPKYSPKEFHPPLSHKGWNLNQPPNFVTPKTIDLNFYPRSETIQFLINDTTHTTITRFDSVTLTIIFSTGESVALIEGYLDNGDGIFDTTSDYHVLSRGKDGDSLFVEDNDTEDENPDVGIWEMTFLPHEDEFIFFSMEGATLFLTATDGGGSATAQINVEGIDSPFSVSGIVTPESANVVILAIPFWTFNHHGDERPGVIWSTLTDSAGNYFMHLPAIDIPAGGHWLVMAVDFLGITDGLFPEIFGEEIFLTGTITGINFHLVPPNAWIVGSIRDASTDGLISDVTVIANSGPYTAISTTDVNGDYEIGVMGYDQGWNIKMNEEDVFPEYIIPHGRHAFVGIGDTWEENFTLYPTDSQVSGWLFLPDPVDLRDIAMFAWQKEGWSYSIVSVSGPTPYEIPVSSLLDSSGGFWVSGWKVDKGDLIFIPEGYEAMSGDTDLNFDLLVPNAFVNGYVHGHWGPWEGPIPDAWVQFSNDSITVTRHTNREGNFHTPLMGDMVYQLRVFAKEFEPFFDSIYVSVGDETWLDIGLNPGGAGSAIEGRVMTLSGEPIPDAHVKAWSWDWTYETWTDEEGFFHMNVEPGHYHIEAFAEGYFSHTHEVSVEFGDVAYVEFYLLPTEGAILGTVTDNMGAPVPEAVVMADGWNYYDWPPHFETTTDDSGNYYLPVINNTYTVTAIHKGFWIERKDSVVVEDSEVQVDFILTEATLTGGVEGRVYFVGPHDFPENPAAWVQVWNEDYFGWTIAFPDSNYYIPLPNGAYHIFAVAEGFHPFYADSAIVIEDNIVQFDIELHSVHEIIPPNLFFIHDIPHDQGRQVRIIWASGDPGPLDYFTEFSIWRYVNESGEDFPIWDYIGSVPWHGSDVYSAVVPTLGDSTAYDIYWSTFMVTAHTENPNLFFDSNPITGYSIDNLVPHTPGGLVSNFSESGILSTWSPPIDEDFQYFAIYRTQEEGPEPEFFATSTDTFFSDMNIDWAAGYYEIYITAFDFNGNESDSSSHSILFWLGNDDERKIPTEYTLYDNYPNPFNPMTSIRFDIPTEGRVILSIYNLLGQEVQTLVNQDMTTGRYRFEWNGTNQSGNLVPSGIYFYRISVNGSDFTETKKMMLLR